jgi:tyrosyl-tRNA synthetase
MLAKESVKSRIEQQQGMSFTEFSYSLLQAYDYLELFDRYHCTLQMGGSDQWGNIVAGVDLIRRMRSAEAHGIVFHLITTSAGVKFGKTESGTVWLDAALTSPYRFYQFWFNTDDRDVLRYLKFFTLLEEPAIRELEQAAAAAPEKREAQSALARAVTQTVHGETALAQAIQASRIFFGGEITDVAEGDLLDIFRDVPSTELARDRLGGEGIAFVDLLVAGKVAQSKGEARRLIEGGGLYLNNRRVADAAMKVAWTDVLHGKFLVLRKGGKNYSLVKVV